MGGTLRPSFGFLLLRLLFLGGVRFGLARALINDDLDISLHALHSWAARAGGHLLNLVRLLLGGLWHQGDSGWQRWSRPPDLHIGKTQAAYKGEHGHDNR